MNFLFGTGLFGAITSGFTQLRGTRDTPITWRRVLAWVSWGITLSLAIGTAIDASRAKRGLPIAADSPIAAKLAKEHEKDAKKRKKELKRAAR